MRIRKFVLPLAVLVVLAVVWLAFKYTSVPASNPAAPQTARAQPIQTEPPIAAPIIAKVAKAEKPEETAPVSEPEQIDPLDTEAELRSQLRDWASKDPNAALVWAFQLPKGHEQDVALESICFGAAQTDPAYAVQLARNLQEPDAVVENLVQDWAQSDVPSALAWANSQPESDQRDQFIHRIAYLWSQTDPFDAANLAVRQIPPGPAQDDAVMTVVHQWATRDFQSASAWVQAFPDSPLKQRAIQELQGIAAYRPN